MSTSSTFSRKPLRERAGLAIQVADAAVALTGSIEERRKQLFEVFLHRKQDPQTVSPYGQSQTIKSLSWLARQINTHRQSAFYLERMQPTWLPDERGRRQYRLLANRLMAGILSVWA